MNYGGLIKDSFWIAWRNRYLWFFGFFAASGGGSYGSSGSTNQAYAGGAEGGLAELEIATIVGIVLMSALLIALSVIAHGGLTDSVAAIERGERRSFRITWGAGWTRFWRVLGFGILVVITAVALFVAVALPIAGLLVIAFVLTEALALQVVAVVMAVIIGLAALVFVFIPLAVVAQFGLRELVLGGTRVTAALRGGWRLIRRNFGRSLLLFVIEYAIVLGAGLVIILAALLLAAPLIVVAIAGSGATTVVAIITGVIVVPLVLVASAAVGTFSHAYWTLAYLRLPAAPAAPAG